MMNRQVVTYLMFLLTTLFISGCAEEQAPVNSVDGEELYSFYCKKCHKKDGSGDLLAGIPANRRTQLEEQQVVLLLLKGDPSRPDMPVFSELSEVQAAAIVDYLFTLKAQ